MQAYGGQDGNPPLPWEQRQAGAQGVGQQAKPVPEQVVESGDKPERQAIHLGHAEGREHGESDALKRAQACWHKEEHLVQGVHGHRHHHSVGKVWRFVPEEEAQQNVRLCPSKSKGKKVPHYRAHKPPGLRGIVGD
jgi:hypothetical protein